MTEVLDLDKKRRALIQDTEALKARRNTVSSQIPVLKKEGKPIDDLKWGVCHL